MTTFMMHNKQCSGVIKTSKSMFTFYTRPTFVINDKRPQMMKGKMMEKKSNSMGIHKFNINITKSVLAVGKKDVVAAPTPNDILDIRGSQID